MCSKKIKSLLFFLLFKSRGSASTDVYCSKHDFWARLRIPQILRKWSTNCSSQPTNNAPGVRMTEVLTNSLKLKQYWSSIGVVLVQYWNTTGTVLGQHWNSTGAALVQYRNSMGTALKQYWSSTGTVLKQYGNSIGTVLLQYWNSTGTVLEQYWNCLLYTSPSPRD